MPLLFPLQKETVVRPVRRLTYFQLRIHKLLVCGGGGAGEGGSRNKKSGAAYGGHLLLDLLLHNRG